MNIVILSRNPRLYSTKRLVEAATKRKHSVQIIDPLMCEIIIEKKNPAVIYKGKYLENIDADITVAVMGCAVNGPGEARAADIGVAGGKGEGLIFINGEIVRKVKDEDLYDELLIEIDKIIEVKKTEAN